jgi:methionyl-tRNA formyltransferase
MSRSLRVVYMGTPQFAVAGLRSILKSNHNVVGIVTAPDRPAGRGKKLTPSAVKTEALAHNIPLFQPEKLNTKEIAAELIALNADVFVVVAFRMLPKAIWSIPQLGTFNLHASLLPQYRGAAPIHWAIINGEKETGLTTFLIDEKIDTGAVLLQQKMAIASGETTGTLSERMQEKSGPMLIETLDTLANGKFTPIVQSNEASLKPAPKLTRINTRINWNETGQDIVNKIHGLNPFPTAWSNLISEEDESYVKLKRAHFVKGTHFNLPGTIHVEEKQLGVAVHDGFVYIDELQLPNKKSMETAALLNGYVFPSKSRFE